MFGPYGPKLTPAICLSLSELGGEGPRSPQRKTKIDRRRGGHVGEAP
jgi:hypothetical protein